MSEDTPDRTETIVCFGTSITEGAPYLSREDAYPAILQRRLNERLRDAGVQVTVINSGVSGHNTTEGLARIQRDVLDHEPDLVVIEFSCNDVRWEPDKRVELDQFKRNLLEMVRLIRGAGADIIVTTPSPIVDAFHVYSLDLDYYDPWGGCNSALKQYEAPIREVALEQDLTVCDIAGAFEELAVAAEFGGKINDASDLRCLAEYIKPEDGVHPTLAGQEVYALALYRIIRLRYLH